MFTFITTTNKTTAYKHNPAIHTTNVVPVNVAIKPNYKHYPVYANVYADQPKICDGDIS